MIFKRLFAARKATPEPAPSLLLATAEAEKFTVPELTLPRAQAELYQRLASVSVAVQTVANIGVTADLSIKTLGGESQDDVPNHPFELLLRRPNPMQSRSELLFETLAFLALTGNAYWFLNKPNEQDAPLEIWVIPPWRIRPIPDGKSYLAGYEYDPGDGHMEVVPVWKVCHFKRFHPANSFVGMSLIEALATDATADLAMQKWNANYFGKDNAKIPGALAFSDFVPDPSWNKIKSDAKEGWAGTNRSGPMMLRGAGTGGVQWVAMALSQSEMEFLQGRQFIKEEIWSGFAPGLASMLAINANEANARTGKATLIELAVWPMLVAIAEKITATIMPLYGAEYIAEFDDIRITDRVMALQEQQAYERTHTIDEIRDEFYEDDPIGDERGLMLPAQVGPSTTTAQDTPDQAQPMDTQQGDMMQEQEDSPEDGQEDTTEAGDMTEMPDQAAVDAELKAWQTFAVNRLSGKGKKREFQTKAISPALAGAIEGALESATTADAVRAVFADVWRGYP